ncbi:MAG: hypothetical protein KME30_19860 [Iphinoe sp. HA4291-MV1]|nr:hypothetical protein [Iphinoe sp. HA4291-MV1]
MTITKKSVSFFLAFLGTLSFSTLVSAVIQQERTNFIPQETISEQEKKVLIAQNLKSCPNPDNPSTLVYLIAGRKSVRVFSSNRKTYMNVAFNNKALIENAEVRIDNENPRIYSAKNQNNTTRYYVVYFNNSQNTQREGLLITRYYNDQLSIEKATCIPYVR